MQHRQVVGRGGRIRRVIQCFELLERKTSSWGVRQTPVIPWKHLDFVQASEVTYDAPSRKPQSVNANARDTQLVGINLPLSRHPPGVTCDQELVSRQVERVESDGVFLADTGLDVGINQHPARALAVPVLANPMIVPDIRIDPEISAKATSQTCGYADTAQERA